MALKQHRDHGTARWKLAAALAVAAVAAYVERVLLEVMLSG